MLVTMRGEARVWRYLAGKADYLVGPGAYWLAHNVYTEGEAGLLGIAVSPTNPNVLYLYATLATGNVVMRATLSGQVLGMPTIILDGIAKNTYHDGGRIRFGPDGYLYVGTGDAGDKTLPQDLGSLNGKILRIVADGTAADGTAAPGNPFGTTVWTYGHRNVQGFAWAADGRMYASELGQNVLDELNLIVPGNNYGWPIHEAILGAPTGTAPGATVDGFTYPVVWWPTDECSPSGITITDEAIYVGALRGARVYRVPLTPTGVGTPTVLLNDLGRIRLVQKGPDGFLYILTSNLDGRGTPVATDDRIVRVTVRQLPG
jgi:glucose/arabinose dehydrogenase